MTEFARPASRVPRTQAAFDGDCPSPGCINIIEQGDEIGQVDGSWVCSLCADDEDDDGLLRPLP